MHLTIKETVAETTLEFDMSGDYEEVLALTSELWYCADDSKTPDTNNCIVINYVEKNIE